MPSYKVQLQGGGDMTVNATDPASAVSNVIVQGGTPAPNTPITVAGGASAATPALNRDLTLAFVVVVLAGIAIAVSDWQAGAKFVQWGLVLAIAILIIRDSPQFTNFLHFLGSGGSG